MLGNLGLNRVLLNVWLKVIIYFWGKCRKCYNVKNELDYILTLYKFYALFRIEKFSD
jgi:hypothetical protein